MARGIIIFGSAGSGKTTLGRLAAQKLGFPFFDLDDYIWRKDTPVPFTVMYFRQEKAGRLMEDISWGTILLWQAPWTTLTLPLSRYLTLLYI